MPDPTLNWATPQGVEAKSDPAKSPMAIAGQGSSESWFDDTGTKNVSVWLTVKVHFNSKASAYAEALLLK